MTPERRSQYLQALGIDVWVQRSAPGTLPSDLPSQEGESTVASKVTAGSPDSSEPFVSSPQAAVRPAVAVTPAAATRVPVPSVRVEQPTAPLPPVQVAEDWPALAEQVRACERCSLCRTRTQAVFGVGATKAPLMIVGEGPGADEDRQGEPFVGAAGKLLDQMLGAIGRSRQSDVYIANVVKCRPPGNRDPLEAEAEACRPYLAKQIELLQPRLIVALGRVAAQRLLGTTEPLARLRSQQHEYAPTGTPVRVTYHPAYLLRSPREKAKSWADLKQVRQHLASDS